MLLQQVADPGSADLQGSHREGRLRVLREDEDADRVAEPGPDLGRRLESFVRLSGRHPDIGDRHVRPGGLHDGQELLSGSGLSHDILPGITQEADDPLP